MTEQMLKFLWVPCKAFPWLGLPICLARMIIVIPADKKQRGKDWLRMISAQEKLSPRELLKFMGLIYLMAVDISHFTKLLQSFIQKWHKAGLIIFHDGLGACGSLEEANFFSTLGRSDL